MQSACSADNRGQMELSPDSPSTRSGPTCRGAHAAIAVLLLLTALGAAGCGGHASSRAEGNASLLFGSRGGPIAASQLSRAAAVADRFAAAYARAAYLPHPPPLPAATPALQRRIEAAAVRVPPARLGLRPRALSVAIEARSAVALSGSVRISDGRSPPFSVGFLVEHRDSRWRVVAISPPS
jgi:hypothetical protein